MSPSLRHIIAVVAFTTSLLGVVRVAALSDCALTPRLPYKVRNETAVWYITPECTRTLIKSSEVFYSHFVSWRSVRTVTEATINRVPVDTQTFLPWGPRRTLESGSLVKAIHDPRVFLILGGNAYPFASEEVFLRMGYRFDWVEDVAPETLRAYRIRSQISGGTSLPPALVFKYPDTPDVFRLSTDGNGQLTTRYLDSIEAIRAIYRPDRIATLYDKPAFAGAAASVVGRENVTFSKSLEQEVVFRQEDISLSELLDPLRSPASTDQLLPLPDFMSDFFSFFPEFPFSFEEPQPTPIRPSVTPPPVAGMTLANASSAVGTNVSMFSDYSNNWPYANFFKQARPWISGERNGCWDCVSGLDLDERGWVRSLRSDRPNGGHVARTPIISADFGSLYPAGQYTVLYDGEGVIEYSGSGALDRTRSRPGRDIVTVRPEDRVSLFLTIVQTNPANYIRNIRVYPPGGACATNRTRLCSVDTDCGGVDQCLSFSEHEGEVLFYPPFLENTSPYSVIRFTQAMRVNGGDASQMINVGDYTELPDATWPRIPPEMIARLGNVLHSDVWVNMPVNASDAFVRDFASRLEQTIDPDRRVYVEYSNESWNLANPYVEEHRILAIRGCQNNQALQSGCDVDMNPGNGVYCEGHPQVFNQSCQLAERLQYSQRTVEVGRIFRDVFHGSPRVIRVMGSQAGNASRHSRLLQTNDAFLEVDALAINAFFGGYLGNNSTVATWNLDQLFRELETVSIPFILSDVQQDVTFLRQNYPHMDLLAYEGGQHLAGVGNLQNNPEMTNLFRAANRDARMGTLYTQFLQAWRERGGKTFVHFIDVAPSSQYGNYGALESQNQSHAAAPKYAALRSFSTDVACWWTNCQNPTIIGTVIAFTPRPEPTQTSLTATTTQVSPVIPPSISNSTALPPIVGFGDEFTNRDTVGHWANRTTIEGAPSLLSRFDVNQSLQGHMVLIPSAGGGVGWDNALRGPYVYKYITGDFVVSARLNVHSLNNSTVAPGRIFNLGGLLARNPQGANARENWVFVSAGTQDLRTTIGTAILHVTENVSNNFRVTAGPQQVALRICRIGSVFRLYRSTDDERTWVELGSLIRSDLPSGLQVGLFTAAGEQGISDVQVDVDYIRAGIPRNQSDCTRAVDRETNPLPSTLGPTTNPPAPPALVPSLAPVNTLPIIAGFGDEFTNQNTVSQWILRSSAEGTQSQLSRFDVNQSVSGNLSMIPFVGSAWVNGEKGPFVYKHITGDFVVSARVNAHSFSGINIPPSRTFNIGGIMARSTASASTRENWIAIDTGTQYSLSAVGNAAFQTTDGVSTGYVSNSSPHDLLLRLCRVGSQFSAYRSLNNGQSWTRLNTYNRPDLSETLQVGLFGAAAEAGTNDVQIDVDYIRAGVPSTVDDCIRDLPIETNPQSSPAPTNNTTPSPSPTSSGSPSPSPSGSPAPSPTPVPNYSDEFSTSTTLANWSARHQTEGTINQLATWDVNTTVPGSMTLIPNQNNVAWWSTSVGPLIYKEITGDFVVSARVNAHSVGNVNSQPGQPINGGGLMVRTPSTAGGSQNWVALNVGNGGVVALVNTTNSYTPYDPPPSSPTNLSLRICRMGSSIRFFRSVDNEVSWQELVQFTRSDFPQTLQVGPMIFAANTSGNPDLQVDYDYIRAIIPQSGADCTASIGPQ